MRKIQNLSFILALVFSFAVAKGAEVDSLKTVLKFADNDTSKVWILKDLAWKLKRNNPDDALAYAQECLELSRDLRFLPGIAEAFKTLGVICRYQGSYEKALEYYNSSLELMKKTGSAKKIAGIYNSIGNIYNSKGKHHEALASYFEALRLMEEVGNKDAISKCYNNIGIVYKDQGNYATSREFYRKSLQIKAEIGDLDGMARSYNNIGTTFQEEKKFDEALEFFSRSLEIKQASDDKRGMAAAYNNLADVYDQKGNDEKALDFITKALANYKLLSDKDGIADCYHIIGSIYRKRGDYGNSLRFLTNSLEISTEIGALPRIKDAYQGLSEAYMDMNNPKKALAHFQMYSDVKDSLISIEKNKALAEMDARYRLEQNQKQIALLKTQKQLKETQLSKEQSRSFSLVIGLTLILILAAVLMMSNRHKQRTNQILAERNGEILNQREEISKQNKELEEKNITLKKVNDEKNYVMGVVAHDLRNPLSKVKGLTELIKLDREKLSEKQVQYLDFILQAVDQQNTMIHKVLDAKSIESQTINLSMEKVDLGKMMEESVNDFQFGAGKKNIKLSFLSNENPYVVEVDKGYTKQVFENLISNALKFSPKETEITVRLDERGNKVVAEVTDQGPGLSKEDLSKMFGKFQKLSARPTGGEKSTGLGLSIVKKYVEAMNGKVWCESELQKGSSFFVEFEKVEA